MWKTVGTVTSQQMPTNPKQHPKRRIFKPQPTYQQLGVEMKGTKLSPGPSLLGGFPKQGLAKEKNQEQASRQQDMHMETSKPNPAAPGIQDTQANSQTPGRFLTKSKYQQSEGKGTCTASCHGYNHVLPCHL